MGINCAIQPTLKYNAATATFHQWRESNMKVVGLNFQSAQDAQMFGKAVQDILELLKDGGQGGQANKQAEMQRLQQEQERERQERERQERERQAREEAERKEKME